MKIAYFDCFAGIGGDMVLGALVDAGLDPALLQAELDKLELPGLSLGFHPATRRALAATRAEVHLRGRPVSPADEYHLETTGTHPHHQLHSILALIRNSGLDPEVKDSACGIFERLGAAEARVHGVEPAAVHLHEVGALDAVADIVGAVAGLRLLGVDRVCASPLRLGTGFVQCAHGRYPLPAPGVLALCREVPCEQTDIRAELVTPTGAAIVTTLAASFGSAPAFRQQRVGYGAGRRDLDEIPNLLRIRLGETEVPLQQDRALLVEANIDDMIPEIYGYLFDLLLECGARDVYITPVQMKKGRPGNLLSVLVDEERLEAVVQTILAETTTIGVRFHPVERRKLERRTTTAHTQYGPVRVKICRFDNRRRLAPEYEDCARLARACQVPILEVYQAAHAAILEE